MLFRFIPRRGQEKYIDYIFKTYYAIIDFAEKNNIYINYSTCSIHIDIYNGYENALKIMRFIYKNYRKFYYLLSTGRRTNKLIHSYDNKIFANYNHDYDYLYNVAPASYYIYL